MRRFTTETLEPSQLIKRLKRPPLEDMEADPRVQERTARVFGRPLAPWEAVEEIVAAVARGGDAAVLDLVRRIDGLELTADRLFVSEEEWQAAYEAVPDENLASIRAALAHIEAYHRRQLPRDWFMSGPGGSLLGQRYIPLERVGVYVPGGRAPLASSALMGVVPARVAGVEEIIVATPARPDGSVDPHVLVAAREAGATRVLRVGGAQAVAALAYGTETVPAVDKIVGPGNAFVALAQKRVFGRVGIEALPGPSEVLVIADDSVDPAWVAADLLSQAEHDPDAAAWLLTPSARLAGAVEAEVERQLAALPDPDTARASWERWGAIVVCRDVAEAVALANLIAPEHLELLVAEPFRWLSAIRHAGAVFLGAASTEPMGDYVAGPNHVLPTNGTARFASALGVESFLKRSSVIAYTWDGLREMGPHAVRMARLEGLEAHARAVEMRLGRQG